MSAQWVAAVYSVICRDAPPVATTEYEWAGFSEAPPAAGWPREDGILEFLVYIARDRYIYCRALIEIFYDFHRFVRA